MKQVSLSRRLTLALVLALTLVVVLVATVLYFVTANRLEQNFARKVEQNLSYLNGTLGPLLWNFDHDTAIQVGQTVLLNDQIVRLTIRNEKGESIFSAHEPGSDVVLVRTQPIRFQDKTVGELEVVFSHDLLDEALAGILRISLLVWLLTVFSIIVLTSLFIRKYFRGPLASLTNLAQSYRQHSTSFPLSDTRFIEFQPIEGVVRDLANDVLMQLQEVQESEAYYRSVFENALFGIAITGPNFKFENVNESWCRMIGYTKDELLNNMGIADVTLPDNIPESMKLMKKLISREVKQGTLEKRYRTKSGEIIDAMTFVKGIYDGNERYLGNAASILDITERKQAELALKESEAKYRRIFESVEDGYILAGMGGEILSVNPATARMLKYENTEELIGKNLARDIYADPRQRDDLKAIIREKGPIKGKLVEFRQKDGRLISAECNINMLFDEANHPIAMEGTFRDVTERNRAEQELKKYRDQLEELVEERTRKLVESEQKYADLYENAPDMFASVDANSGKIIQCNQTLLNKTNYSKDEVVGKHIFKIYQPDCHDKAKLTFEQFQTKGEVRNAELLIRKKDGTSIEVLLNATAIRDKNGKPMHSRSTWLDITERKKAEKALLDAKKTLETANNRLQELDQLKSLFISSMSHEFRTPLNSIIGFTGILAMEMVGKLEPKQKDFLNRVNQSSTHLLSLINDVIDISKIEAGKFETFNSNFLLGTVIDETVKQVEALRNEKGLELRVDVPANIQMTSDRKRVSQCILNYLANSIKYTEKGWISISARQLDGNAEVVVEDTGIGVSEDDLPKLFQQFVRLDSPLRMKEMGTGLGLYLTKKMASEILGGTVGAESQLGVGSKFYLSIPTNRQSNKYGMKVGSPGEIDEDCINH
jgi:PAS domain S-box-containing protein